jgi:hypothetical protein
VEVRFVKRLCAADDDPVIAEEEAAEGGDGGDPEQISEAKFLSVWLD